MDENTTDENTSGADGDNTPQDEIGGEDAGEGAGEFEFLTNGFVDPAFCWSRYITPPPPPNPYYHNYDAYLNCLKGIL